MFDPVNISPASVNFVLLGCMFICLGLSDLLFRRLETCYLSDTSLVTHKSDLIFMSVFAMILALVIGFLFFRAPYPDPMFSIGLVVAGALFLILSSVSFLFDSLYRLIPNVIPVGMCLLSGLFWYGELLSVEDVQHGLSIGALIVFLLMLAPSSWVGRGDLKLIIAVSPLAGDLMFDVMAVAFALQLLLSFIFNRHDKNAELPFAPFMFFALGIMVVPTFF